MVNSLKINTDMEKNDLLKLLIPYQYTITTIENFDEIKNKLGGYNPYLFDQDSKIQPFENKKFCSSYRSTITRDQLFYFNKDLLYRAYLLYKSNLVDKSLIRKIIGTEYYLTLGNYSNITAGHCLGYFYNLSIAKRLDTSSTNKLIIDKNFIHLYIAILFTEKANYDSYHNYYQFTKRLYNLFIKEYGVIPNKHYKELPDGQLFDFLPKLGNDYLSPDKSIIYRDENFYFNIPNNQTLVSKYIFNEKDILELFFNKQDSVYFFIVEATHIKYKNQIPLDGILDTLGIILL